MKQALSTLVLLAAVMATLMFIFNATAEAAEIKSNGIVYDDEFFTAEGDVYLYRGHRHTFWVLHTEFITDGGDKVWEQGDNGVGLAAYGIGSSGYANLSFYSVPAFTYEPRAYLFDYRWITSEGDWMFNAYNINLDPYSLEGASTYQTSLWHGLGLDMSLETTTAAEGKRGIWQQAGSFLLVAGDKGINITTQNEGTVPAPDTVILVLSGLLMLGLVLGSRWQ